MLTPDHLTRKRQDPEELTHESNQDNFAGSKQEYPESEIDDWDWDELEASLISFLPHTDSSLF